MRCCRLRSWSRFTVRASQPRGHLWALSNTPPAHRLQVHAAPSPLVWLWAREGEGDGEGPHRPPFSSPTPITIVLTDVLVKSFLVFVKSSIPLFNPNDLVSLDITLAPAAGPDNLAGESYTSTDIMAGKDAMAFEVAPAQDGAKAHTISTSGLNGDVSSNGDIQQLLFTLDTAMLPGATDPILWAGAFSVFFDPLPTGVTLAAGEQTVRLHAMPSVHAPPPGLGPHCPLFEY
jgi:hypothetical protein